MAEYLPKGEILTVLSQGINEKLGEYSIRPLTEPELGVRPKLSGNSSGQASFVEVAIDQPIVTTHGVKAFIKTCYETGQLACDETGQIVYPLVKLDS